MTSNAHRFLVRDPVFLDFLDVHGREIERLVVHQPFGDLAARPVDLERVRLERVLEMRETEDESKRHERCCRPRMTAATCSFVLVAFLVPLAASLAQSTSSVQTDDVRIAFGRSDPMTTCRPADTGVSSMTATKSSSSTTATPVRRLT